MYVDVCEGPYVDLMVMQRSCSSLRVSVKRVSPALAPAMIPALETYKPKKITKTLINLRGVMGRGRLSTLTKESVKVDLP